MSVLSIIIVSYNVKFYLEQCLSSVFYASKNIDTEIFVVDNQSTDDSVQMIETKFNDVILIKNNKNVGFSKANNQAIKKAKGKYILLLNPDTVVQEDTFEQCLHFMEENTEAGAVGVEMIDGKGQYLPESKRAFPSPLIAFYKISGLSILFPKSKKFGKYHLTHLDHNKTQAVDVLSGAYMFIRKKALDKSGLLDEDFFMYGEDIDLSHRIIKAGYKNYYLPATTIIHYKGESTKKISLGYVIVFYKAMNIFAKKHFYPENQFIYLFFIRPAIAFCAAIAIVSMFVIKWPLSKVKNIFLS